MNFMELAQARYSVRSFSAQPIETDKMQKILAAGQIAPTAKNNQPQKIYVVQSEAGLAKIRRVTQCHYNAPVVLIVAYDKDQEWKNPIENGVASGQQDASIVATHMMLEAQDLGIGSVWVNMFSPSEVKEVFNLPENIVPVLLLPLGYAQPDAHPSAWHTQKKPIEETVTML